MCQQASEDFFNKGESVQVVMVKAKVPMPTGVNEKENTDSCEVELGG